MQVPSNTAAAMNFVRSNCSSNYSWYRYDDGQDGASIKTRAAEPVNTS